MNEEEGEFFSATRSYDTRFQWFRVSVYQCFCQVTTDEVGSVVSSIVNEDLVGSECASCYSTTNKASMRSYKTERW
jgi:hypothetical protein